jgi:hypothetical protein
MEGLRLGKLRHALARLREQERNCAGGGNTRSSSSQEEAHFPSVNNCCMQDVIARTTTAQYRAPEMCDLYVAAA